MSAEHEFVRDVPYRKVCFSCRKVYAGRQHWTHKLPHFSKWRSGRVCVCGGPLYPIGHHVEVPKRRNTMGWLALYGKVNWQRPSSKEVYAGVLARRWGG